MGMELLTNEATVAERLGVARAVLRDLRKNGAVIEGEHWHRGENQAVEYLPAGIKKIAADLGLGDGSPAPDVLEEIAAAPTHVELVIYRTVRNHRLVLAVRTPEELRACNPSLLRVSVKNSKKMRPGMVLELCRHVSADLYAFEGRKPRRATISAPSGQSQETQK